MELLVIRHAIALDREEFAETGVSDDLRPLTKGGRAKMRREAPALARLVPGVQLLVASPLVRARDTAAILERAYEGVMVETEESLRPDAAPSEFTRWLRGQPEVDTVAAVGHEPHLGMLVSWLLARRRTPFVSLKKGGACLLAFDEPPREGRARLVWAMPPAALRALAASDRASR